jgi:hypothetical protein
MAWAALVAWIATALGGAVLGRQWLRRGGARQRDGIRTLRLGAHVTLAVAGLALWAGYVASGSNALAWLAVALLIGVILIGLTMLAIWLAGHSPREPTNLPAEASFPLPVIVAHGALGLTTLTLSILAAAGFGA